MTGRWDSGLPPGEEARILCLCFGIPLLLLWIACLWNKQKRRKFCAANQYRVIGEVLSARQVTATVEAACWELTVQFQNEHDETETARVTTCDPAAARAKSVELALIPASAMPQERALDRMTRMNAREQRRLSLEESRQLVQTMMREYRENVQPDFSHPGYGVQRVRLWEERFVTSMEQIRRKQFRKKLIPALVMIVLALAGMCGLAVLGSPSVKEVNRMIGMTNAIAYMERAA